MGSLVAKDSFWSTPISLKFAPPEYYASRHWHWLLHPITPASCPEVCNLKYSER